MTSAGRLGVLQVSTRDIHAGGAESIAWMLFLIYRALGLDSHLAVGVRVSDDPDIHSIAGNEALIPHRVKASGRLFSEYFHRRLQDPKRANRLRRELILERIQNHISGLENFSFPGSWKLVRHIPPAPSIVHCHNLHGGYFDLRMLPWLSRRFPTVVTLHDAWMLSGHCAHSLDCERWKTGCGACPDLTIYPALRKDGTASNWIRKRDIYKNSRLFLVTPSDWLMDRVRQSMLWPAVERCRVIPNGVNLGYFHPTTDRALVRQQLGLPQDSFILMTAANGLRNNPWKDWKMMRAAIGRLGGETIPKPCLLLALGDSAPPEQLGAIGIQFIPLERNQERVAHYFQAADLYLHAARADTFPTVVLEALACGTPVLATSVGGIPEQVRSLHSPGGLSAGVEEYSIDEATGQLVAPGDVDAMAAAIRRSMDEPELLARLGRNAAKDAYHRFDRRLQVRRYLQWYAETLEVWGVDYDPAAPIRAVRRWSA